MQSPLSEDFQDSFALENSTFPDSFKPENTQLIDQLLPRSTPKSNRRCPRSSDRPLGPYGAPIHVRYSVSGPDLTGELLAPLLFDTTVYIDQLKGDLPRSVIDLVASRTILHGAPALAELAVTIGVLNGQQKFPRPRFAIANKAASRCSALPTKADADAIHRLAGRSPRQRGAAHLVRLLLHFPFALLSDRAWPVG